jgi:predicted RNA-binding protein
MKTEEKIYDQHAEHTDWLSKMKFYTDEISVIKNRLGEVASKNTDKEILAHVEHFQNQMIIQKNNIDEISHAIKLDEEALQKEIKDNPTAVDHRKVTYHAKEKDAVDSFEKNFNEIRNEFKVFAAKWM